jgi:hypothetical protein
MIENKVDSCVCVERRRYSALGKSGGDYGPDARVQRSRRHVQCAREAVLLGMRHRWVQTVDNCVGKCGRKRVERG